MTLSDIVAGGFVIIFIVFGVFMLVTMFTNTSNARSSYEYGVGIGERFCDERNGELEKVPDYMFRTIPNYEPRYIECKEVHDSKIEYNRYELVKGNYYEVLQ